MFKNVAFLALACGLYGIQAQAASNTSRASSQQINAVIEWNRTLLAIVRTPGSQSPTIHSTRNFAILHAAIYDAIVNIDPQFTPYLISLSEVSNHASAVAAADAAAHDVLVSLYPAFRPSLDAELKQDIARLPANDKTSDGIAIGQAVAAQLLAVRANDGANITAPPYAPGTQPGDYQLTPPNFASADFTQWPQVTPFALTRANQFRPGFPPTLTSAVYSQAFNEVKAIGLINSTSRTSEQTQIGMFWNGNIQDFWNEIAQTAALDHHLDLENSARLFALLNISLADTAIAFLTPSTVTTSGGRLLQFSWRRAMEIRKLTQIPHGFHWGPKPLPIRPTLGLIAQLAKRAQRS